MCSPTLIEGAPRLRRVVLQEVDISEKGLAG